MSVNRGQDAPKGHLPGQNHVPTPERSRNMAAIRRTDTQPERRLRSAIHARGLRFRKDYPIRASGRLIRPDIAFTKCKVAVFVDGCFWHGCPDHGRPPKSNVEYWNAKLSSNAARDTLQTSILQAHGWIVIRIWSHTDVSEAVEIIRKTVTERDEMANNGKP
ncbi:very short patch repair endonuclease [Mycobacteroides abscessus subsp. abscessus]|uniref:very short patch repair endonuclease n=1 Tax=Mycobacteroides abscessus TaxID=36809 RepID=UPI00266BEDAC|nr:very short patch repair endonuclease [Mycobacteroides abscessus]MDO3166658.1 very short patch repair endonuclease [Mycobacteroides abscessus subsp. abscessus]